MSSSSTRTGLLRVLHDGGDRVPLSRWKPGGPGSVDGNHAVVDPFEAARVSGYEAGYLAAQAETDTVIEAERGRVRSALVEAADAVARTRVEAVATMTSEVVELALELTEVFFQRELTLSDSIDTDAVARALALAPTGDDLVVRLHPGQGTEAAEIGALANGVSVKVIEDPAIERGGCVLEVGACRIDAQMRPAIERARKLIAGPTTSTTTPTEGQP